jgi:hypothetical protein
VREFPSRSDSRNGFELRHDVLDRGAACNDSFADDVFKKWLSERDEPLRVFGSPEFDAALSAEPTTAVQTRGQLSRY